MTTPERRAFHYMTLAQRSERRAAAEAASAAAIAAAADTTGEEKAAREAERAQKYCIEARRAARQAEQAYEEATAYSEDCRKAAKSPEAQKQFYEQAREAALRAMDAAKKAGNWATKTLMSNEATAAAAPAAAALTKLQKRAQTRQRIEEAITTLKATQLDRNSTADYCTAAAAVTAARATTAAARATAEAEEAGRGLLALDDSTGAKLRDAEQILEAAEEQAEEARKLARQAREGLNPDLFRKAAQYASKAVQLLEAAKRNLQKESA